MANGPEKSSQVTILQIKQRAPAKATRQNDRQKAHVQLLLLLMSMKPPESPPKSLCIQPETSFGLNVDLNVNGARRSLRAKFIHIFRPSYLFEQPIPFSFLYTLGHLYCTFLALEGILLSFFLRKNETKQSGKCQEAPKRINLPKQNRVFMDQ